MRQLTSLDAQFLAVESARIYGHVAFLGDHHVAYTDVDGGKATVHVLTLPE